MSDKSEPRDWLKLPSSITESIFTVLGPVEILQTVKNVCTLWRNITKDPSLWRSIDFKDWGDCEYEYDDWAIADMCEQAVDLSSGGLVDICLRDFGSDKLLAHIADRSPHLKRLRLVSCPDLLDHGMRKAISQLSELEELEISYCSGISPVTLEAIGRGCPQLKSFKLNDDHDASYDDEDVISYKGSWNDFVARAIAQHMPNLHHLQLFANTITNRGLLAILDGCPHLESLDLRHCFNVNLQGDVEKRCTTQIKHLLRPHDSIQDYEYNETYLKSSLSREDGDEDYSGGYFDTDYYMPTSNNHNNNSHGYRSRQWISDGGASPDYKEYMVDHDCFIDDDEFW